MLLNLRSVFREPARLSRDEETLSHRRTLSVPDDELELCGKEACAGTTRLLVADEGSQATRLCSLSDSKPPSSTLCTRMSPPRARPAEIWTADKSSPTGALSLDACAPKLPLGGF
ncbi:hypothetical protein MTO96_046469 [Rhipicephalus appendiculatus]